MAFSAMSLDLGDASGCWNVAIWIADCCDHHFIEVRVYRQDVKGSKGIAFGYTRVQRTNCYFFHGWWCMGWWKRLIVMQANKQIIKIF
ncbi:MAG: hypothetical protein Q8N35_00800 [Methylococcaceae bacterium]|nr:hypothetical protein [Methylococcaceae bacterium]